MSTARSLQGIALALALAVAACGEGLEVEPTRQPYGPDGITGCLPNLDGRIEADELPMVANFPLSFRISPDGEERSIVPGGAIADDGVREWDWADDHASDLELTVAAVDVSTRWYADEFPEANVAVPLVPTGAAADVEAVYQKDTDALWLLGFASRGPAPAEGRTLMVYDSAIELLRLPLEPGLTWQSSSDVHDGTLRGLPYASSDSYSMKVEAAGRLRLPDLTFTQAHQVRTSLVVTPVFSAPVTVRQIAFVFECFGEVARATSRDGEVRADFTTAAEIRRLGL
jgi:hypothetical protein